MSGDKRDFYKQAAALGFQPDGFDGRGHPRLRHDNGKRVSISLTPSDIRWRKNALAKLKRVARGQ